MRKYGFSKIKPPNGGFFVCNVLSLSLLLLRTSHRRSVAIQKVKRMILIILTGLPRSLRSLAMTRVPGVYINWIALHSFAMIGGLLPVQG